MRRLRRRRKAAGELRELGMWREGAAAVLGVGKRRETAREGEEQQEGRGRRSSREERVARAARRPSDGSRNVALGADGGGDWRWWTLVMAGAGGWRLLALMDGWVPEWWMDMDDEAGGAPPHRPGRGGGRR